jgi:hypothetical protein
VLVLVLVLVIYTVNDLCSCDAVLIRLLIDVVVALQMVTLLIFFLPEQEQYLVHCVSVRWVSVPVLLQVPVYVRHVWMSKAATAASGWQPTQPQPNKLSNYTIKQLSLKTSQLSY